MLNALRKYGAVLAIVALAAFMPAAGMAAVLADHSPTAHHGSLLGFLVSAGLAVAGTVTVTYSSFAADNPSPQFGTAYTGGTTAPTALQSSQVNRVNALIAFTDSDTTISFTHNFGLSAAAAAANEPDLIVYDTALGSSNTQQSNITWSVSNTNVAVGTKTNLAGSGRTISLTARRPASPGN